LSHALVVALEVIAGDQQEHELVEIAARPALLIGKEFDQPVREGGTVIIPPATRIFTGRGTSVEADLTLRLVGTSLAGASGWCVLT
jgi:hypothetical protein